MLNIYFLNESFAWSIVGCLGSLPVTAQQNPPDFGHPIRNMSKGLPESKKTSEFTLSTKVAVEYEYLGREAYLKNPRSVRFRLTKAEITLYLYRAVRNYKLEIKWQKQNYKPAKQSGR